jgi:hypothetical protein
MILIAIKSLAEPSNAEPIARRFGAISCAASSDARAE